MREEIEKIEAYYSEGQKQWPVNPEFVIGRQFYELWEKIHQPVPFAISTTSLAVLDRSIEIPDDTGLVGCVNWDANEECCSLDIEGDRSEQKILLTFEDGLPVFHEKPIFFSDILELSFGERLEIIYDLIASAKKSAVNVDILKLSRLQYTELLNSIAFKYPENAIKVMRKLPLRSIHKLVGKASEDMAADEVDSQLVLPLDGHYAMAKGSEEEETVADNDRCSLVSNELTALTVKRRTRWAIVRDLEFIRLAMESLIAYEERYIITFSSSEVLQERSGTEYILRVPVNPDVTIREGETLKVYVRGQKSPVGIFAVDLYEGYSVVGRLSAVHEGGPIDIDARLFARPRRSPNLFLMASLSQLLLTLRKDKTFPSPVLNSVLGVTNLTIKTKVVPSSSVTHRLDNSQTCAKINAVYPDNPIVIVQGPPGTGKTHVLERVIRELVEQNKRILMTAPSNTAVDNVSRRLFDLPVLRIGYEPNSIAQDVRDVCWIESVEAVSEFKRKRQTTGTVYCGTHIGILRDELVNAEIEKKGLFDVVVFDEAGMTGFVEFILCIQLAKRVVLFGDHQQLPPFPLPKKIIEELNENGPAQRPQWSCLTQSALEWLITQRGLTPHLLNLSYRCQNPRLLRFSSTLFYNARVKTSERADYFRLSFEERHKKYPTSSLRLFRTSSLPTAVRKERFVLEGKRPGIENPLEAKIAVRIFYELLQRYPFSEITIIAPYRRQVRLIRSNLSWNNLQRNGSVEIPSESDWKHFLHTRISTVDSFQGGESDAVIICYVRSNDDNGIGFVDAPNRINVAHTRCRREMIIIGDLECLKRQSGNTIFHRMERAIDRDGEIIDVTQQWLTTDPAISPCKVG